MNVFETVGIIYLCVLDVIIILGNIFVFGLILCNPRLRNATGENLNLSLSSALELKPSGYLIK